MRLWQRVWFHHSKASIEQINPFVSDSLSAETLGQHYPLWHFTYWLWSPTTQWTNLSALTILSRGSCKNSIYCSFKNHPCAYRIRSASPRQFSHLFSVLSEIVAVFSVLVQVSYLSNEETPHYSLISWHVGTTVVCSYIIFLWYPRDTTHTIACVVTQPKV